MGLFTRREQGGVFVGRVSGTRHWSEHETNSIKRNGELRWAIMQCHKNPSSVSDVCGHLNWVPLLCRILPLGESSPVVSPGRSFTMTQWNQWDYTMGFLFCSSHTVCWWSPFHSKIHNAFHVWNYYSTRNLLGSPWAQVDQCPLSSEWTQKWKLYLLFILIMLMGTWQEET